MYRALYRKWRPQRFEDVVAQRGIVTALRNQIATGRVGHAYLFTGVRGTGKTSCAKIFAKAVNCLHPQNGDPCGECEICRGIDNGSILDVVEMDAASNNGVDDIRDLRDETAYTPSACHYKVYIIDEVHMLSTAAFNALLKTLEEPPAHVIFILATTEIQKVPATILSRCQRYSFKRILPKDIAKRLAYVAQQEQIDLTPDGAELLSRLADGALRDGLSLLDQCAAAGGTVDSRAVLEVLGLAGNLQTAQLMQDILDRNAQAALLLLNELYAGGKDVGAVLGELSTLTRDLLLRKTAPEGGAALLSGGFDSATLDKLGKGVPANRFLYLASTLQKAAADLYYSADRRTDAELCLLRLCDESLCGDLTALENRVTRLEDALERGAEIRTAVKQSVAAAEPPQAAEKPAPRPAKAAPPPAEDPPPWDEPPLPEEPPMREEPGERVFDIPADAVPVRPAAPQAPAVRESVPQRQSASIPAAPKASPSAASAVSGGNWWRSLAENCKGQLPPMYRAFLELCGGTLAGNQVTVYAPDEITLNRLDNDRVRGILAAEAEKASGQAVRILFQVGEAPKASPQENLKSLLEFGSRFDNIDIN